ncbi:MAG: hypothetical protein HYX34_13535 [Actinobacteria bacterium]|nr:hypothetical protein [Actinomycetota bacterium]
MPASPPTRPRSASRTAAARSATSAPPAAGLNPAGLARILEDLDDALGYDADHPSYLIELTGPPGHSARPRLAELPPSVHPLQVLLGHRAPAECAAIGVVALGRATVLSDSGADHRLHTRSAASAPGVVRVAHLVARTGSCAGRLRPLDPAGPSRALTAGTGRIADACSRALRLSTPPPEAPVRAWFDARWCEALVTAVAAHPAGPWSWPALAACHPLPEAAAASSPGALPPLVAEAAASTDWEAVRRRAAAGDGVAGLDGATVAWLDAGSFSRFVLDELPAPTEVVAWLRLLAGPTPAGLVGAALGLPGNPGPARGPG